MPKISITITGELEFPEHLRDIVSILIDQNFIVGLPKMAAHPFVLHFSTIQKTKEA